MLLFLILITIIIKLIIPKINKLLLLLFKIWIMVHANVWLESVSAPSKNNY
jgi:hypothetical protein